MGRCRSSAGVCMCRPGCFRCRPGSSRCRAGRCRFFPVTPGGIKHFNTLPVEPRFSPMEMIHPGRARIMHRGSAGIIVRLGLYTDKERCTDCVRCLT
ncbi:hypothetical protein DPMN_118109 [Dreissena polymorpha]|uniref:Uncharacterized protein n=1 Tax=Dreissena polymorpha TaxID=45954 RepID=A0A9D4JLD1_DREPO|nr:hypothetical protein DPMN_118109 [Dreissena polymorpha]